MITGTRASMSADIARQQRLAQEIARAQADISTGTRIQAASDDPAAAARVSQIARAEADRLVWTGNADVAATQAAQADGALDALQTAIDRARELMIAGNSATLSADDRKAVATELKGIAADIRAARGAIDSRGQPVFPEDDPLAIPIGEGTRITATLSAIKLFDGVDTVDGPVGLAELVDAAAASMSETDPALRGPAAQTALAGIVDGVAHLAALRADQGVRAARIDAVRDQLAETATRLEEERGGLEGTDLTAAIARVNGKMLSLQAAQALFARVNKSSLFDLLG